MKNLGKPNLGLTTRLVFLESKSCPYIGFPGFPTWLHIMFPAGFHGHRSRKSPILHSVSGFLFPYKLPCGTMSDTE